MDKTDILNTLFYGHFEILDKNFSKELIEKAGRYRDKHLSDPDPEFVKGLYNEMPELSILDIQLIKNKLISINKSINTIRGIIVFTFIISIIVTVIYLFSILMATSDL